MPGCYRILIGLLWAILLATGSHAQPQSLVDDGPVRFAHLTIDDGLSQQSVYAMLQDRHGFMWFGTADGLNKYDGYDFIHYRHDPNDPNSLSTDPIFALLEDRDGKIWIGHDGGGLSRFDPVAETFTHYRHDEDDSTSLSSDRIRTLYEDRQGTLWIGARVGGFNRFDPATETFARLVPDPEGWTGTNAVAVWSILEDALGILWIGGGRGLFRYDPSVDGTKAFTRFLFAPEEQTPLGINWVSALYEDRQGALWVGGWGLHRFDRETEAFEQFLIDPEADEDRAFGVNRVTAIVEDHTGALWVGCTSTPNKTGGGLNRFNREMETFTRYLHDPDDPSSLNDDHVLSLYEDRQGMLWVGTLGGLSRIDRTTRLFTTYPSGPSKPNGFQGGSAAGIFLDRNDVLWIGTAGGVLNRLDRRHGTITHYRFHSAEPTSLVPGTISTIHRDRQGRLWIGTLGNGLIRFDEAAGHFVSYLHDPEVATSLSGSAIWSIHEDRAGRLWVGTFVGLDRFNPEDGTFTRYVHAPDEVVRAMDMDRDSEKSIDTNGVSTLYEDHAGQFWVGTGDGLKRFNTENETFIHYPHAASDSTGPNNNIITDLYERPQEPGVLWISTDFGGLYRMDARTGRITRHYTAQNSGLPSNTIWSVLGDDQGTLWLSTNYGLVRLDPVRERFEAFGIEDGLQALEFGPWAVHRGFNGELFFGGSRGVNAIRPEAVVNNPHPPEVALTGLRLFNEPVVPGPDAPLKVSLAETDSIVFSHAENDLTLEYVGLHFRHPERNTYAYMLEGYDEAWRAVGTERRAVYTSLPPGAYVFRVKAANSDGVWTEEGRSLAIMIRPPWWRTPWAYVLYGFILVAGVVAVDRVQRRRLIRKERQRTMQREIEQARQIEAMNRRLRAHEQQLEAQNRKLLKLDELKSRFFANISHEFRTPLTLILGPLDDALSDGSNSNRLFRLAPLMRRNARRLLRLINQLLDLSKLEAGGLHLHPQPTDLGRFLQRLVLVFSARADREGITLRCDDPGEDTLVGAVDRDKLEKVVTNLLSNALKFTMRGGKVRVALQAVPTEPSSQETGSIGWAEIIVEDTGQGIPPEALPYVFDRFYQVDTSVTRGHEGSGIGLALTKELVELHGGTIAVDSTEGFGTCFTVRLPLRPAETESDEDAPGALEVNSGDGALTLEDDEGIMLPESVQPDGGPAQPATEPVEIHGASTVLIVEDNADMRAYLRGLLHAEGYRVEAACDGQEGLERARALTPALIISDIMMPRMDGVALCRALKASASLGHVPVVLLTARAAKEDRLEGLGAGADDYLAKPFSADELLLRTENLIEIRRRLRARFSKQVRLGASEIVVSSQEAAFVAQIREVAESELSNSQLTMEQVAEAVGLSLRQVHRRLKAAVGLTPAGYVRMLRLERAAQLLQRETGTVAEVAYAVGFNDAEYFSRLFKQTHGVPPSQYQKTRRPA